jgi:hypothetical protein
MPGPGDWRVVCDASGFDCWASETVLQWNGLRVLHRFAEQRHPQDMLKAVPDRQAVPWTRPVQPIRSVSPFIEDSNGFSLSDSNSSILMEN